jgi:hypothetical protein
MQQLGQPTATGRENPLGELDQFKSFVHALAAAILCNANGFEGVWSITNRVYDRWAYDQASLPGRVAQLHSEQDLARSA